jgi:TIGR03009 family protein
VTDPLNVPRAALVPPAPLQPEWYPLDPKVQQWVDSVLTFWEQRSDQVKTLECTFQKWEYDPSYMPNELVRLQAANQLHLLPFAKYAEGQIKYAAPDKGLFHVKKLQVYAQGKPGEKTQYTAQPAENGEHWVTDGKRVFAFDAIRKEVIESQLPPEMQGKSLADGPLPFMFGAKAESIKARYWIRPLQAESKGEYCLEAIPKGRQDAANFKSVQIVLDEEVYLPTKMQIFEADYSPANPHRTAYKFDKREVNAKDLIGNLADPLKLWHRDFYDVKTPSGWRRVVRDANGNTVGPASTVAGPPVGPQPAQATRPGQALPMQR